MFVSAGNYGKLGHGDHVTQKVPKLVEALSGKVGCICVCVYMYVCVGFVGVCVC